VSRLSAEDVDAIAEAVVKKLIARAPKKRKRPPCGRGSSAPNCYASAVHGWEACICR
jgi:hypothetical protein